MQSVILKYNKYLEGFVNLCGRLGAWAIIGLMLVIVTDVILRRFFVIGSTQLQELEWHLHGALFLLAMGWAYQKNAHVRIELVSEKLSNRRKAHVELWGTLLLLAPYSVSLIWFGTDYLMLSWAYGEASPSPTGLGARYIIKGIMVFGFVLLGLTAVARIIDVGLYLFGEPDTQRKTSFFNLVHSAPHTNSDPQKKVEEWQS